MTTLIPETPADPASAAPYPVGLALDIVLEVGTLDQILKSYDISPDRFEIIQQNPAFKQELEGHRESMKIEGWSFRKKAQAQAELYLGLLYRLASSDTTPAAVRADIMKTTVKWAGLEAPVQNSTAPEAQIPQLMEQMKNLSDGELELRVFQLISRRQKQEPDILPATPTHAPLTIDIAPTRIPDAVPTHYDPLNS